MKKIYSRLSREVSDSLIVIILLTIVFAYNDRKEITSIASWTSNLVLTFVIVAISVLVLILGYKLAAKYYGNALTYGLWRIGQEEEKYFIRAFHIPLTKYLGQILAIIMTLLSSGLIYFAAVSNFSNKVKSKRKKFRYETNYENSMTAIIGILFSFIALFFFRLMDSDIGTLVNTWMIVGNLIPFSTLPGAHIATKSRTAYVFVVALSIFILSLIEVLSIKATVIIALIFAIILTLVYFRYIEYGEKMFGNSF